MTDHVMQAPVGDRPPRPTAELSPALRTRLQSQDWLAHNIRLDAHTTTIPGRPDFLETDQRFEAVVRILETLVGSSLTGMTVADLGCLEGGFSLGLALRGAEVTGFEAHQLNVEKLGLLAEHFRLPNLHFVLGDVKEFSEQRTGRWDGVLALGILYHLDRPVEWLQQVARTTDLLIVETHFAPPDASLSRLDSRITLGPMEAISVDGRAYEGRWFHEFGPEHDPELQLLASYSNRSSFWLSRRSLFQAIVDAGFPSVWEYHESSTPEEWDRITVVYPRTMLVAVKGRRR